MATIKIPVTGLDAQVAKVPEHDHLNAVQSSTDYMHGDGFWPMYQDKMAKVEAGTGLNVTVKDYFALIDGYKVAYRGIKNLNWTLKSTINVAAAVGAGVRYLALKAGLEDSKKENKEGVFFLTATAPNAAGVIVVDATTDAIPVAKLTIPGGTTQVTAGMIDNSVKKWLSDLDKTTEKLMELIAAGSGGNGVNAVSFEHLFSEVNKLHWKVDTLTTVNQLAAVNGYSDILRDTIRINESLSSQWLHTSSGIAVGSGGASAPFDVTWATLGEGARLSEHPELVTNLSGSDGIVSNGLLRSDDDLRSTVTFRPTGVFNSEAEYQTIWNGIGYESAQGRGQGGLEVGLGFRNIDTNQTGGGNLDLYMYDGGVHVSGYFIIGGTYMNASLDSPMLLGIDDPDTEITIKLTMDHKFVLDINSPMWGVYHNEMPITILDGMNIEQQMPRLGVKNGAAMARTRVNVLQQATSATVVFNAATASGTNDSAYVFAEASGDVTYYVSRDNGTTFTVATPGVELDISGQPAGTQMVLKVTLNTSAAKVDNVGLYWK